MARQIDVIQNEDHVSGNFQWEKKPTCSCGRLMQAVEEKFIFVSNFVKGQGEDRQNVFYMMPVNADGYLANSDGITIENCPWCGDPIRGRKKYPTK